MDASRAGLRAQDYHESLRNFQTFPAKDVYFGKTLKVGKAATLAAHLKGIQYIDDVDSLVCVASSLGITFLELDSILSTLQEIDFVRAVTKSPGDLQTLTRLDVRVPEFGDAYADLGKYLIGSKPTEIEQAGVAFLDTLIAEPKDESHLSTLGLDKKSTAIMMDVMRSGQLAREQSANGKRLIFSPLAIDTNPTVYLNWANKFKDDVAGILELLSSHQGLALTSTDLASNAALNEAIFSGVIVPVTISGATGQQKFAFAPRGGLSETQRTILDKARAVLACVRYGQEFSAGVRIKYPSAILRQLLVSRRFNKSHPDMKTQYALLIEKGMAQVEETSPGFYNINFLDTDENVHALTIAIEMLETGHTPSAKIDISAHATLLQAGGYDNALATRPKLAETMKVSEGTMGDIISKASNFARGIYRD
jgi:hypothetical protein